MTESPNRLSQFWQEFKHRRVFQAVVIYATSAFVILDLIDKVAEPLDFPEQTSRVTILSLFALLPLVLVFSWIFEITRQGIIKTIIWYIVLVWFSLEIASWWAPLLFPPKHIHLLISFLITVIPIIIIFCLVRK